jgi:hypothetical protein
MSSGLPITNKRSVFKRIVMLPATLVLCMASSAWAVTIDSVRVDRVNQKIIVKGSGFEVSTGFTLGGVSVPTVNVSATQLDIRHPAIHIWI